MKFKQYENPDSVGYQGWIETQEGNIAGFVQLDGTIQWSW